MKYPHLSVCSVLTKHLIFSIIIISQKCIDRCTSKSSNKTQYQWNFMNEHWWILFIEFYEQQQKFHWWISNVGHKWWNNSKNIFIKFIYFCSLIEIKNDSLYSTFIDCVREWNNKNNISFKHFYFCHFIYSTSSVVLSIESHRMT